MFNSPRPRRRRPGLTIAAGTAAIALLVSACGSTSSSSSSNPVATSSAAAEASAGGSVGADAFPVEITTAFGAATIEAAPEKVAVIGYTEGDTVLALGTVPVSFFEFAFPGAVGGPWATELLDGQKPVLLKSELNVEQVAALQPDLIIGINQALTQQQYDQLSKIAPTLARPAEYTDFGVPPQVQAEMIGQALGQSAEIAEQGAAVAEQVADAAADNPAFEGKTVSVVWPSQDGSWFAWSTTDPRVQLMESLGLVQSPQIAALGTDAFFHTVSAENTAQIDAEVIVVLDVNGVKSTVEANPVFNSLDAVKNGQVVWVTDPNVIGALSYGSVLSLPYAIDAIVPALAETIGAAAISSSGAVVTGN
jgi:iron complex transport system substrate-binding protein